MKVKVSKSKVVMTALGGLALCLPITILMAAPDLAENFLSQRPFNHIYPILMALLETTYPIANLLVALLFSLIINALASSNSYAYQSNGFLVYPNFLIRKPLVVRLSEIKDMIYETGNVQIKKKNGQEMSLSSTAFESEAEIKKFVESLRPRFESSCSLIVSKASIKTKEELQKALAIAERSFSLSKEKFLTQFKRGDVTLSEKLDASKAKGLSKKLTELGIKNYTKENPEQPKSADNFGYAMPTLVYLVGVSSVPGFFMLWTFYVNYRLKNLGIKTLGFGFILLALIAEIIQLGYANHVDIPTVSVFFVLDYAISIIFSLKILQSLEGVGVRYSKPLAVLFGSLYANYKINRIGSEAFKLANA